MPSHRRYIQHNKIRNIAMLKDAMRESVFISHSGDIYINVNFVLPSVFGLWFGKLFRKGFILEVKGSSGKPSHRDL